MTMDWMRKDLNSGVDDFRNYINEMIALRADLLGEPWRALHVKNGKLFDGERFYEEFHGTQSFGHRQPKITSAVRDFLDSDCVNWYPARVNPFSGSLARKLCERANSAVDISENDLTAYHNVFFANSGSEAVEAAIKLARAATGKKRILSLMGAYHGCTMGSCSLMHPGRFKDLFAPYLPGTEVLPFGDIDALNFAMSQGDVACVVVEPIQLEGGVNILSESYIAALAELTQKHSSLLIADEIQTGLGRTGKFLSSQDWPRRPDIVVLGKHLGGGLLPISAMMTTKAWFERAYTGDYASAEAHNTTFGGNALACVAAHATLDLLTDNLIERIGDLGNYFRNIINSSCADNSLFVEAKGAGLLTGIKLKDVNHPWLSFEHFGVPGLQSEPSVGVLVCYRMYKRGFYPFVCGHQWNTLRILPRFNIEKEILKQFGETLAEELNQLCELT